MYSWQRKAQARQGGRQVRQGGGIEKGNEIEASLYTPITTHASMSAVPVLVSSSASPCNASQSVHMPTELESKFSNEVSASICNGPVRPVPSCSSHFLSTAGHLPFRDKRCLLSRRSWDVRASDAVCKCGLQPVSIATPPGFMVRSALLNLLLRQSLRQPRTATVLARDLSSASPSELDLLRSGS